MLYDRDKDIIEKLKLHSKGEYQRFSQGDVEYIIHCIRVLAKVEAEREANKFSNH